MERKRRRQGQHADERREGMDGEDEANERVAERWRRKNETRWREKEERDEIKLKIINIFIIITFFSQTRVLNSVERHIAID